MKNFFEILKFFLISIRTRSCEILSIILLPSFLHRCKAKAPIRTYQGTLLLIQSLNEGHLQLQSFHERLPPSQFRVTIIVLIQQISAFFIFDIFKAIFFNCLLDLGTKFLCFFFYNFGFRWVMKFY